MGLFTELIVSSNSYIFDGAGGMRDQLEQTILGELQQKKYPLRAALQDEKSGGILGTREQCIIVDIGNGHRVVVSNTTVGSYLYVSIYHLLKVMNTANQINMAYTITDIFKHQHMQAAYSACVAACESAFSKLQLKQINSGYKPMTGGAN